MLFGPKNSFHNPFPPNLDLEESPKNNDHLKIFTEPIAEKETENSSPVIKIMIRRFIQKLKENVFPKSLPKLKLSDLLSLISDEVYMMQKEGKSGCSKKITTYFNKYLTRSVITPDNPIRMIWNIFLIFYLGFCFIFIPVEISFELEGFINNFLDYFMVFIFLIDIFINFMTADFIKGFLVLNPKILFKNYLKSYFIFDILALMYSIMELVNDGMKIDHTKFMSFYKFLILAKIPRFFSASRNVSNYLKLEYKYQEVIDMLKLITYSLFMAHILACLWYMCSSINPTKNWIINYGIQEENNKIKYIYSLYWTIVTIMTVGYGDITPQNEYEVLFASFTIIFGCVLYAFNLNTIGIILQNYQKKENEFKNNLRIINNFMDRKNIEIKLQRRVQEYLNFMWNEQKSSNNEEENTIINKLNETLKEELLLESYGGIFLNTPLFIKNFSEKSLRKIVKTIKEVKFIPGEEIFERNISDDCSLYYINKGSVEIYLSRNDKDSDNIIKICKKGEIFGENSFFTGFDRDFSCRSLELTSVLIINRKTAINIFKENKEDYESYCMIKDDILLQNDYKLLNHRCFYCRSLKHTIKNCNFLHFIPDIEKIIKKYEFYNEEPRKAFSRRKYKKFSIHLIAKDAKKFQTTQDKSASNLLSKCLTTQLSDKAKFHAESLEFLDNDEVNSNFNQSEYLSHKILQELEEIREEQKEISNPATDIDIKECMREKASLTIPKSEIKSNTTLIKLNSMFKVIPKEYNNYPSENEEKKEIEEKEKNSYFEKMKNFTKYYPKMNCNEVLKKIKIWNLQKRELLLMSRNCLPNFPNDPLIKVFTLKTQRMKNYTICMGEFRNILIHSLLKSVHLNYSLKNHPEGFSPNIKRKKSFSGFLESKKIHQEKTFGSLVSSLLKKPKRFIKAATLKLKKKKFKNSKV